MRLASWFVLAIAAGGIAPAAGQNAVPSSAPRMAAPATPGGSAGARPVIQPAPAESESEQRIKRREEASKRTLRSICRGC